MTTVYDETFETLRKEFYSTELQDIRPGYLKDVASHIRRLKEAQRNLDQKSLKAAILEEELTRIQLLVSQLLEKRTEKIMRAAARGLQVSVGPWEKWVLEELTAIARHIDRVREDVVHGQEPAISPEKKKGTVLLRFVQDVPS